MDAVLICEIATAFFVYCLTISHNNCIATLFLGGRGRRGRERETHTHTHTQRETDRQTDRQTDRDREIQRQTGSVDAVSSSSSWHDSLNIPTRIKGLSIQYAQLHGLPELPFLKSRLRDERAERVYSHCTKLSVLFKNVSLK